MCPYREVPQEPGQKVSAKLCYRNNFKGAGGTMKKDENVKMSLSRGPI